MGVGNPSGKKRNNYVVIILYSDIAQSYYNNSKYSINLRPAEYVDGAGGGFVPKHLNIRYGLRHLEGVLLLRVLVLFLQLLKHHHQGGCQVLQRSRKMDQRLELSHTSIQSREM